MTVTLDALSAGGSGAHLHTAEISITQTNQAIANFITIGATASILLVGIATNATSAGTGTWTVVWDSGGTNQAMTAVGAEVFNGSQSVIIFGLVNPTTGTKSLGVKNSGTSYVGGVNCYVAGTSWIGSETSSVANATEGFASNTGNSAQAAVTSAASIPNTDVAYLIVNNTVATFADPKTPSDGGTLIDQDGNLITAYGAARYAGAGSTIAAKWDIGASGTWAAAVVGVKVPAAGAAPFLYFQGLDSTPPLPNPLSNRFAKKAALMRGHEGIDAQLIRFLPNDRDTHPFQPPARQNRIDDAGAIFGGDQGTQATFIRFLPNDWDTHPPQPPARQNRIDDAGALFGGDQGTQFPLILFLPFGWWTPPFQPPAPPWVDHSPARFGALVKGDDGIQSTFVRFFPYGWEIPSPQPPHPRPERAGAIMPWEAGIEATFVFTPPAGTVTWGWEQPQTLLLQRYLPDGRAVLDFGDQGTQAQFSRWLNSGWEVAPFQPSHPRAERSGALATNEPGIESPFVNWVWGFEIAPFQPPHRRYVDPDVGDAGIQSPFVRFFPSGWEIAPHQPQHQRPERSGLQFWGDQGTEASLIVPFQEGWQVPPMQPPHPRPERAGAFMPSEPGVEAVFVFVPLTSFPEGWQVPPFQPPSPSWRLDRFAGIVRGQDGTEFPFIRFIVNDWDTHPHQPQHSRPERAGLLFGSDQGTQSTFVLFRANDWDVHPFQPPHPRPERSASWMVGDQGTEAVFVFTPPFFQPYGWEVASPQPPHPRPERSGFLTTWHAGTDAPFIRFIPNDWDVHPHQPQHRGQEWKAAALFRGDDGTQFRLIVPFREGWHVPPFQPPHPKPERFGSIVIGHVGIESPFVFVPLSARLRVDPRFISWPPARKFSTVPLLLRRNASWPPTRKSSTVSLLLRRQFSSYPQARTSVTSPRSASRLGMPQGNDLSTLNPTETVTDTWDFAPWLSTGVTVGAPATTCSVISGTDPTPQSRLIGNPVVITSPTTGNANQAVAQQVQGMLAGVLYLLLCTVTTSDNQVLTLYAHQKCESPK